MIYLGADGHYYQGVYTPSAGWDDATTSAEPTTGNTVTGKSAPSAASVGTSLVFGFTGDDGTLDRDMKSGTAWGDVAAIPGAATFASAPTLIAFDNGGTHDLMMVYTGSDLALHSVTRTASNKAWNSPIIVDNSAQPSGTTSVAPMTNGRAMAVYVGANSKPYWTVYDPTKVTPWSAPAELVAGKNPLVASVPVVVEGKCGAADATAVYADQAGGVHVMRFVSGAWSGPFAVPGIAKASWVGVGERS
jgi:hypothetical protein